MLSQHCLTSIGYSSLLKGQTSLSTANMVKYFSVDWLIQSDAPTKQELEPKDTSTHLRPHVPCLVQPRQPTSFNKSYLQPKPKVNKSLDFTDKPTQQDPVEACRPASCSSPSKYPIQIMILYFSFISTQSDRANYMCLTILLFKLSFRNQWLFIGLWKWSGLFWMPVCGWWTGSGEGVWPAPGSN